MRPPNRNEFDTPGLPQANTDSIYIKLNVGKKNKPAFPCFPKQFHVLLYLDLYVLLLDKLSNKKMCLRISKKANKFHILSFMIKIKN